jgi:hypothetical protein
MHAAFAPSHERGVQLDTAVRARLATSLDSITTTLDGALDTDSAALFALTDAVRAHPVSPAVMSLYAELVPALTENEARARAILAALAAPAWRRRADLRIVTIRDADLGAGMADCYLHHLNDDPDQSLAMTLPDDAALQDGRTRMLAALALLQRGFPALGAEIGAIVNEMLLVGSSPTLGSPGFHGASSFYLWGALLLNVDAHPTRVALIEGLAHESGHSVLHGLTMGAPLVVNDATIRHPSPLREDPRPMDGIVHATYVLARMHLALATMLRSGELSAAEHAEATARVAEIADDYADGLAVVASAARFTDVGAAAFAGATTYMAEAVGIKSPAFAAA